MHILERATALSPLGTAISLWPNALACMSTWGIADDLDKIGVPFGKISTRKPDGTPIVEYDLTKLHQKHHHTSRCVTRSDLHSLLGSHLPDRALHLGATATRVQETDSTATLHLSDGTQVNADLIVIADGQNSTLREQVIGPSTLHPAGYDAILGLADIRPPLPGWGETAEACEYYGPNGRFGILRSGVAKLTDSLSHLIFQPRHRQQPEIPLGYTDNYVTGPTFPEICSQPRH